MNHHLADQLQAACDSLWRTIDLLEPAKMETGRLENKWTPNGWAWDEFQAVVLQGWPSVGVEKLAPRHGDGDTDALNARRLAKRAHLTMIGIGDGLLTHHRRTLRAFDRASDEQLHSSGDCGWETYANL